MSIQLYIGNVGSGKTAYAVKQMMENTGLHYYTNIKTDLPNVTLINSDMICKKELLGQTAAGKKNYAFHLNLDYWKNLKGNVNVVIDEFHSIMDSRRSMSKSNIVIGQFISMLRRVLGENSTNAGDLILITQLPYRIDNIAREMARTILSFRCHYYKNCNTCGLRWKEHSDFPEDLKKCPRCHNFSLTKSGHLVEIKAFANIKEYGNQEMYPNKRFYYKNWYERGIKKSFVHYDTLQWDNLFSDLYK